MHWKRFLFAILIVCSYIVIDCHQANALQHTKSSATQCKELNQINCYMGENEGQFCNKAKSETVNRWFFDKGVCRVFRYRGCYGNRNRFCTKEACEKRCK